MTSIVPSQSCTAPGQDEAVRLVLMVRRSKAFWLDGQIDPALIVNDPAKAATVSAGIEWWDRTFWLGYRDFRIALRGIAASLIQQVGFDDVIPWQDEGAVRQEPAGTWLVPADEDDWLSPELGGRLRDLCSATRRDVLTWDVVRKSADGTARLNPNAFVESCGYAVRLPFDWMPICDHMHLRPPERRAVPEVLSVRNETPASMAFLYKNPPERYLPTLRRAMTGTADQVPPAFRETWERYQSLLTRLSASMRKPS